MQSVGTATSTVLYSLLHILLLLLYDCSILLGLLAPATALQAVKHSADTLVERPAVSFLLKWLFAEGTDQPLVQPLGQAVSVENMSGGTRGLTDNVLVLELVETNDAGLSLAKRLSKELRPQRSDNLLDDSG